MAGEKLETFHSIQRIPRGVRIASCRYIGGNYFFAVSFASNFTAWRSP